MAGQADAWCIIKHNNKLLHIEIEVKTENDIQRKEQKDWQRLIESLGGLYILVRKPEDAIESIANYLKK